MTIGIYGERSRNKPLVFVMQSNDFNWYTLCPILSAIYAAFGNKIPDNSGKEQKEDELKNAGVLLHTRRAQFSSV